MGINRKAREERKDFLRPSDVNSSKVFSDGISTASGMGGTDYP